MICQLKFIHNFEASGRNHDARCQTCSNGIEGSQSLDETSKTAFFGLSACQYSGARKKVDKTRIEIFIETR